MAVAHLALDLGIVKKSGAWYTYDGEQLGQGRENAKVFLTENPELMVAISEQIRQQVGIGDAVGVSGGEAKAVTPADGFGPNDDEPITLD